MSAAHNLVLLTVERPGQPRAFWLQALRRLARNRAALVAVVVIGLLGLVGALAPLLAPYDPRAQDLHSTFKAPSLFHGFLEPGSERFLDFDSHVLGTDNLGRDWLSRLMYGARVSLTVGVFAQAVVLAVGLPVGLAAGYFGGRVDALLMRFTDMAYAFPELLLIILMRSITGGSIFMLFLVIGLAGWMSDARLVRGQVLALKERDFVTAAHALGASPVEVMRRHLLPNSLGPLIVATSFGIPRAIFIEASLSFIGIGVSPGTPSWGSMVQEGYQAIFAFPHLVLFPALAISALMLSFTFLGDGVRDALDPRATRAEEGKLQAEARPAPGVKGRGERVGESRAA
jgi:oligopeptide transport system permease protein